MSIEDKYLDILQNIEFAIVEMADERSDVSDYSVIRALDALIGLYRAESRGHTQKPVTLDDPEWEVFETVKIVCEWRMGRKETPNLTQIPMEEAKTVDDILTCLRKIRRSVDKWNRRGGPEGYLNFVSQYV